MMKIEVLRSRKRRILTDIAANEAHLISSTQSQEIQTYRARVSELKMQVESIDSILNAVEKLNGPKKMEPGAEIMTELNLVPVLQTQKKEKKKRGRPSKRKVKKEKPLFEI